jgi:hypothetical protein
MPAAGEGDAYRKPLRAVTRRLQYAVALLVCSIAALVLYEIMGDFLRGHPVPTGGWPASVGDKCLHWLASLTPGVILMMLAGGIIPQRPLARLFWLGVGVSLSAIAGKVLQDFFLEGLDTAWLIAHPRSVLANTLTIALPCALMVAVYEFYRRSLDAEEAAFHVHAARISIEAELSKARLRLLSAQIEPHFIFNSLAHVRRLYQVDPVTGEEMLSSLIQYFASALPSLRRETCSLAEEATLLDAYLGIHRLRMGSRLAYEVAFPAQLLAEQVPTMILLTLVENAIKHGLSPLPEGGFVRVSALAGTNRLEVRVADTGHGMTQSSGHGTGLANIRARLSNLYGSAASVTLTSNQPRGITATVRLPLLRATA